MRHAATSAKRRILMVFRHVSPGRLGILVVLVAGVGWVVWWRLGAQALVTVLAYIAGVLTTRAIEGAPHSLLQFLQPTQLQQLRGERYQIGGQKLAASIIDLPPGGYRISSIDITVSTEDLDVPEALQSAALRMEQILSEHPHRGDIVFDNNPCLVLPAPPTITREGTPTREVPGLRFEVARTSYFVKAMARGCPPTQLLAHLDEWWPDDVLHPSQVRHWLTRDADPKYRYLLSPNFGLTLALTLRWGSLEEQTCGVYQVRGLATATNPGRLGVPISEAFSVLDQDPNSHFINVEWAAQRAAGEELGLPAHETEVRIAGLVMDIHGNDTVDPFGTRSGGGYNFVGSVEATMSPEQFAELWPRDRFENKEMHTYPLTAHGLAATLGSYPPRQWFAPAVVSMLSALEVEDSRGPTKVGVLLRDMNWGQ